MAAQPWMTSLTPSPGIELIQFYTAWDGCRGDDLVPRRDQIDYAEFLDLLPEVAIFELTTDGDLIYRYMGAETVKRSEVDLTGRSVLDLFPDHRRDTILSHAREVVQQPCGNYQLFDANNHDGGLADLECMSLPVMTNDGDMSLLFTLSHPRGNVFPQSAGKPFALGMVLFELYHFDIGAGVPAKEDA